MAVALAALAGAAAYAPDASAYVYWTGTPFSISRANLDGSGSQVLSSDAIQPIGIAVDGSYIYWNNGEWISRANLDGSNVDQNFIGPPIPGAGTGRTGGLAVDGQHIYWTSYNDAASPSTGAVGRANLDGSNVDGSFIAPGPGPGSQLAVDGAHIYWTSRNYSSTPNSGTIGQASLDGSGANQSFVTVTNGPTALAVRGGHLYWSTYDYSTGTSTIVRDGLTLITIANSTGIGGLAVDSAHIYWSDGDSIGRANLDGSNMDKTFISGSGALAVDGLGPGGGSGGGGGGGPGGTIPATLTKTKKVFHWSATKTLVKAAVILDDELHIDDTLTATAKFSNTMRKPKVTPRGFQLGIPGEVDVTTSSGDVKLSLFGGNTVGAPAGVSTDPAYPQIIKWSLPSLGALALAAAPRAGWFIIPLGTISRSVTVTLKQIAPLVFGMTLANETVPTLFISEDELLVPVAAAVVVATLPEDALAVVGALAVRGIPIAGAYSKVLGILERVLPALLKRVAGGGVTVVTIPGGVAGAASAVWNSLTSAFSFALVNRSSAFGARTRLAPDLGPATHLAQLRPLRRADLHGLRAQQLRGPLATAATASLLSLPVRSIVRPLVESRTLPRGGRAVVLLGGALPGTKAQIVIKGPGYRAVRDVRIVRRLAGGRVVLPRRRRPGRWYAGIADYSRLRVARGHVIGRAILEAASWLVRR